MPEFDDVMQPAHFRSQLDFNPVSTIDRYTVLLKDGETTATIYPLQSSEDLPPGLLAFLCDEFNIEIERGDTFAFFDTLHIETFQNYWFGSFAGVMVLGDSPTLEGPKHWEKECLGTFFVKPNHPGRASHICTAGFLVNAGIRGKGIGRTLTDCFLQWAPRLGYTYCVFNLVFETNVAARRIWESLNFKRIGRIKSAGILKGHETAVDAIIYGRELVTLSDTTQGAYRFDKIKFYLETGKYPAMADRNEKSRLRSSASHYRIELGKLMLRDKEVVSDPVRQLQLCTEAHMENHGGINKTTSAISEKYHWTRIKDTVSAAIKNCETCRETAKEEIAMKRNTIDKKIMQDMADSRANLNKQMRKRNRCANEPDDVGNMSVLGHMPNRETERMLTHDLSGLDEGLIAAVEAAQKRHRSNLDARASREVHSLHDSSHSSPVPTYAAVAASGGHADTAFYQNEFHAFTSKYSNNKGRTPRDDNVPVDPDVSAFDHNDNSGGDEIEIARVLMQSNESEMSGHQSIRQDKANGQQASKNRGAAVHGEASAFSHSASGRDELDIADALMETGDVGQHAGRVKLRHNRPDETNMFFKPE